MAKKAKLELTEEKVRQAFGEPRLIKNSEWIYPCPLCLDEDCDSDHDHLKINIAKGCITCFANKEHSKELIKLYLKNIEPKPKASTASLEVSYEQLKTLHNELKNNKDATELLKSKGYDEQIISRMQIGLYCGDWFVLPMQTLDNELIGYEFRDSNNFKFSHKSKGYADDEKKTLCLVNDSRKYDNLLVMAGFKDAHIMWQYLQETGQLLDYTIITASNGEPNTLRALNANFSFVKKFKKIILCLDKDQTGKASTKKIALELGLTVHELRLPFIENDNNKSFKDFTDWYNLAKETEYKASLFPQKIEIIPESLLNKYIRPDDDFDKAKRFDNSEDEHELSALQSGIYPTKWGYYKTIHRNKYIILQRETNYIFKITRKVISSNNKFDVENTHKLEIYTMLDGKATKSVIFSPDDLTKPESIMDVLNTNGTHFSCLNADELKAVLYSEYRNCSQTLHVFENPGIAKIGESDYWLYKNACVDIKNGEIIRAQKDHLLKQGVIKLENNCEIALSPTKGMKAPELPDRALVENKNDKYRYLDETAILYKNMYLETPTRLNILASALIRNTLEAYNCSIEPFMLIGNIIMSPLFDIVYKQLKAYPISYGYGEARSGKSNILELCAKIFGYGVDYLSGGNDTSNNLMHNMEYYNKTPILFSEIETNIRKRFQENVKAIYDRSPRKIMKGYGQQQDIKAINGTIHFATNDMLPKNEQTMTRLIFTEFKQNNFICEKAKPFNVIRNDLIALILPEILFYLNCPEYIDNLIHKNILEMELLEKETSNLQIDNRSKNNLAVAKTGIDLLFEISGLDIKKASNEIEQMQVNYKNFLVQYASLIETKDHFLAFMEILTELFRQEKAVQGQDYKFYDGGLAIYLKPLMPVFREVLKRTGEQFEYIPTEKEIKHAAEKHGCKSNHNVDFSGETRRALVIPKSVDGIDYIISLITGPENNRRAAGEVI